MKLVVIAAFIAVCGAAKLDRTYLPPQSAATAGGNPESLQTPLSRSSSGEGESSGSLPTGSYTNNFQGVVVDAAAAGIRASPDDDQSGLGGSRDSYGSTNSKVGDAAFKGSVAGFRNTPTFGSPGLNGPVAGFIGVQNFGVESKSERPQASKDRNSNIITYANDVSSDNYSYGFETDNGIAIGENGVSNNGIQAQGGYSYKGDDGQVYKVTYVADEGGYRPVGDHLPTPPPIPKEILESLEQNAKEEAAGLVDDGSYDAQKYNAEGDYMHHNGGNTQYNGAQLSQFSKRPESDASASNTFINQNSQAFGKPGQLINTGAQNTHSNFNGQYNQFGGNKFGSNFANNQNDLAGSQAKQPSQSISEHQESSSNVHHSSGHFGHNSGSQLTSQLGQNTFGGQSNQIGTQNNQQQPETQFGSEVNQLGSATQFSQLGSSGNQEGSASQFGAQPTQPSFGQTSHSGFNSQSNQGTQYGNQGFKPQGSFSSPSTLNSFGKPSQYNDDNQGHSLVSQTQFTSQGSNTPSLSSLVTQKPSNIAHEQINTIASNVADNGNRFPNTQFGAEYLPPFNKPQINEASTPQDSNINNQIPNFVPLDGQNQGSQGSSASSFASVGSGGFGTQPAKPFDVIQSQPLRPNQFNYNKNNQLTSQGQSVSNAFSTSSLHSGSQAVPTLATGAKPTTVPETELTTPLEPNEKPTSSQEPQVNSQTSPNFGNFGSQTLNNQAQPQIGFQNSIAQHSTSQTIAPSFPDSRPQGIPQFGSASPTQAVFPATVQPGSNEGKPQFPQNSFGQNLQNNAYYSTEKPSQGSDESYYYNQPSRPFSSPAARPDASRFPSSPSYQSNGVVSSYNNQFTNNQASPSTANKFPISPSLAPVAPTSSQFTQPQGNPSTNYYNGITQASISSFPSVSPTTSSQHSTTQADQFGYKPSLNQPSLQFQPNKPTISQQNSEVPSFSAKPTTFGQKPSYTQIQFGQSSSNNKVPSVTQSFPSNSASTFGQTSFTQNQNQFGQSTLTNNDQPQTPEISQEQQTTSTQQYQGTVYEYNKPAEVLPAPAQTDSFSSQSVQTNSSSKPQEAQEPIIQASKPQFGSQQTQFGQTSFLSQSQQFNLNQGTNHQTFKPFGSSSSSNAPFNQNTQSTFSQTSLQQSTQESQGSVKPEKPNESTSFTTTQFGQTSQVGLGSSGSQFGTQPAKPFGSTISHSQFGTNTQKPQGTGHTSGFTSSGHTQELQSGVQSFKPFGGAQSTTNQFGHNTQTGLGSQSLQQDSGYQYAVQSNKPLGSASSPSQFGQAAQTQGSHNGFTGTQQNTQSSQNGAQPLKPFGNTGLTQGAQSAFGTTETPPGFQGYPSSKPQLGTQLTQTQFAQTSQQTFGSTQISSQPALGSQADTPAKPFGTNPSVHGSPDTQKPHFGQNTQLNQGSSYGQQSFQGTQFGSVASKPQDKPQIQFNQNQNASPNRPIHGNPDSQKPQYGNLNQGTQPSGSSYGQQSLQSTQFGSAALKPQVESHTQNGQNQFPSPIKPFVSASSQAHYGQASAHASSSDVTQQQPQNIQDYKPFGASSAQGSSFSTQHKPQYDQAPQTSEDSSTSSQLQFGAQPFKPFSSLGAEGSQKNPEAPQNKLFGTQQGSPCCQGSTASSSSSIGPLNVGKPSQAFAQTQSQFTGFPGAQGFNAQNVASKGEEFGGPRQPPSFDAETGYHY